MERKIENLEVDNAKLINAFKQGFVDEIELQYYSALVKFCFYFSYFNEPGYEVLRKELERSVKLTGILKDLQTKLQRDAISEARIATFIVENLDLMKPLCEDFKSFHKDGKKPFYNKELGNMIMGKLAKHIHKRFCQSFLTFNKCCIKTNFFEEKKDCLAFRIEPKFFENTAYPEAPFALYMFVSKFFCGFHVRFDKIARGGIRIIRSFNEDHYLKNSKNVFDEQYDLAHTQNLKNKDLPESGSKGVILLSLESTKEKRGDICFHKFVNGFLDLIVDSKIHDFSDGIPEVIFLGPDEGSAELMGWAVKRAKERGYKYWKTICTGKDLSLGGIPHDIFGMTTAGVHEYVLGCLGKAGVKEEDITKCQTGGPDGDLGSNEILISKDKTVAIIDGNGTAYDPHGLNREELVRLAKNRLTIDNFNTEKLSKDGFMIPCTAKNVTLPNGEVVEDGVQFRNTFHLHPLFKADLFVPCGGRPKAVNVSNVDTYIDQGGNPRFKWIVEGANLFFTDEARDRLESAGCTLFKDASANKGGVTSSSLEVLCGLALDDKEYEECMMIKDNKRTEFYYKYVEVILEKIKENARLEFECITKIKKKTRKPSYQVTVIVSKKINELAQTIKNSDLWKSKDFVKNVLSEAVPKILIDKVGIDKILERVPEDYLKNLFGSFLAKKFIYTKGILDGELMAFYTFITSYLVKKN